MKPFLKLFLIIFLILNISYVSATEKGSLVGCYKKAQHNVRSSLRYVRNCFNYCSNQFFRYSILYENVCECENVLRTAEVDKEKCNRKCSNAGEEINCGGDEFESVYTTGNNLPGAVQNLAVNYVTENKIVLVFNHPERNQSELSGFEARVVVMNTYSSDEWAKRNITKTILKSIPKLELSDLTPSTEYNISIVSKNGNLDGGITSVTVATRLAAPHPPPKPPKILYFSNGASTATVEIERAVNNNGPISSYLVVVHFVDHDLFQDMNTDLLGTYQKARDDGLSYYITAEIDSFLDESKTFVIGDGSRSGSGKSYFNAPLPSDKHFHVMIGLVSRLFNEEKVTYSNSSHEEIHNHHPQILIGDLNEEGTSDAVIVMLTVACIICGVILVGSILFYGYIRTKINPRIHRFERHEMSLQGPILEVDNNGFISDVSGINFKERLQEVLLSLDDDQKIVRKNLSLDIDNIIGIGSFGDVIRGRLNSNVTCQIHVISADDLDPPVQTKIIRDLNSLLQFGFHRNMLTFMGICQTHDWFFVVFEDTPVTLKQFLLSSRQETSNQLASQRATNLGENELIRLMYELSETMEYLQYNKIVHKNLNSYTVRVKRQNSAYTVKLSIFGPTLYNIGDDGSKNMIDEDRWFAPEVLRFQKFTYASDVYSFALVLWEISSLGATIYGSVATNDLLSRIKKGLRPDKYAFISEDLYQLMLNCWEIDPNERSEITDVAAHLKQMQSSPNHYLNYSYDGQLPYYLPLLEIKN